MPRPSRWNDVVAAAANVFRERGYHATRLEDIADELGMQKASLYNYVPSKEALLLAVVRPPADRLIALLTELAGSDLPASEKIRLVARGHAEIIDEFLPYVAVYVQEMAGRAEEAEWREMDRRYVRLLCDIIAEGQRSGLFSASLRPMSTAMSLIGALNWMTRWYRPDGAMSAEEISMQIADVFLSGLFSRNHGNHAAAPQPSA